MKVVIAEKPSVAKEIAKNFGAKILKDGYVEGGDTCYTWAFGHLISLAPPESYGFTGWNIENLPMIPPVFKLEIPKIKGKEDAGVVKQLKVIEDLFNRCDEIIVATDAGREGELIFRYIYEYLQCKKPFKRLWISSQTTKAIQDGFNNLKPGKDYDQLYYAGLSRSQSDWLIGMNSTQALSLSAQSKKVLSLGRVQTPTLALICSRFLLNSNFKATPYYKLYLKLEKNGLVFTASLKSSIATKEDATKLLTQTNQINTAAVTSLIKTDKTEKPPKLFDLTALQQEANKRYGFSANETLEIAQSLYEAKLITYPRTGSTYISADVFDEVASLMKSFTSFTKISSHLRAQASQIINQGLSNAPVNDAKVTDHHALLPTDPIVNYSNTLSEKQDKIYTLILIRMLQAFHMNCIKATQAIEFTAGAIYQAFGSIIKVPGWRAVALHEEVPEESEDNPEELNLPELSLGENLPIHDVSMKELFTKPKPLYTEGTLLQAMQTCGKELEDKELREGLKDLGLGTPATRASIIETLFTRNYIIRDKKKIIPTDIGLLVYDVIKDKAISQVEMTGKWERKLEQISIGEVPYEIFMENIKGYTRQITGELMASGAALINHPMLNPYINLKSCPKCKIGKVKFGDKAAYCSEYQKGCDFKVWKQIAGKSLTETQINELITKNISPLIKGFQGKEEGKTFDARLKLKDDFTTEFLFENSKKGSKKSGPKGKPKGTFKL